VAIASLTFSTCSKYLCCSSNTETVHIFKLERQAAADPKDEANTKDDWYGYLSKAVSSYLPMALPSNVTFFSQDRAFASAVLPMAGLRHSCVITTIQKSLK
jgi:autophagy-related protein 18